jgi:hypothetical protein
VRTGRVPMFTKRWSALISALVLLQWAGIAGAKENLAWELAEASSQGNLALVESLLDKGANANSRDRFGNPALKRAMDGSHLDAMKLLSEKRRRRQYPGLLIALPKSSVLPVSMAHYSSSLFGV